MFRSKVRRWPAGVGQICDDGLQLAVGLRGVQRVEPILQLGDAESTVASRLPQLLGDAVTIRVRGTHRAVVARLLHDDRP